ncbi:hypothetical protein [Mangrovactinospora gilvigrisea]|nr:hypothetical protein [Mangrovactinospora gilvigrisea]
MRHFPDWIRRRLREMEGAALKGAASTVGSAAVTGIIWWVHSH